MRLKHALAATTAAVFLSAVGVAHAQQTTPRATEPGPSAAPSDSMAPSASSPAMKNSAALDRSTLHEIKDNNVTASSLNVNAKDLKGMDIYGSDGKKLGDVDKVLGDNANSIKAVTVDVGGFLGIGSREVVIPVDKLQKGTEKNRLQVSMTKNEIEKLDKWENADRGTRRTPESAETPRTAPPSTQPSPPATQPSR